MGKARRAKPFEDVAAVCGKDEQGIHILRRRAAGAPIEVGVLQPLAEGKPITGEVISMRPREDVPFLLDVTTELDARPTSPTMNRPAQVATESYRRGWDAIWGSRSGSRRVPLN